jgi:FtsP/CotA-like multicopper oxidase with cupredoxin domain
MNDRRSFFGRLASAGAGLLAGKQALAAYAPPEPVEMPDLKKLPHRMVDGVKEFHLVATVVRTEFVPGRPVDAWGFNGTVPGPLMEANEGDRVRVVFHNNLPEMTALHWHGFEVPMEMDGSLGVGQDPVPPGGMFTYEFTLHQHGTFFYHSHFPMQEMMGMLGMFILHPKQPQTPRVDRDFGLVIQEWALLPNNNVPNTLAMEFNWLTFNGKAGPDCTPMLVRQGERVRIRMINIGMDHHPIHMHGVTFYVTGTEAGRVPQSMWIPQNTVLVGVAQARDIEFDAKYVGDWMLHCHLPHHMMNQMVTMVGPMSHGPGTFPIDDPDKKKVPGYPQDMWMNLDAQVRPKAEHHGLRSGWAAAMMGMMTLVRVLPPDQFDEIIRRKAKGEPPVLRPGGGPPAGHEHHHPKANGGAK